MSLFGNRSGLAAGEIDIVARVVPCWSYLRAPEQEHLIEDTDRLMRIKHWEAAQGFALTDAIRVHIAAQAALLILGLGITVYRGVSAIIVHPTTMIRDRPRPGPVAGSLIDGPLALLGEAAPGEGPVVVAWDAVRSDARHQERGHNVVFHEFAHKIDMIDGAADGNPPLPNRVERERWITVCREAFERLRAGHESTVLREYAAVNPGEFFAVATEVFFTIPRELARVEPVLYDVLAAFYRQEPAARLNAVDADGAGPKYPAPGEAPGSARVAP